MNRFQKEMIKWENSYNALKGFHVSKTLKLVNEIKDLKQQLTEKDKEIKEYKRICTIAHVEDLQIENMLLKCKVQNKISFAIEQINILVNRVIDRSELIKIDKNESCFMFDVYDLNMCSQELIRELKQK